MPVYHRPDDRWRRRRVVRPVPVDKDEDRRILPRRCDAGGAGAPIAATRLDDYAGAGSDSDLGSPVTRAAVDNEHFVDADGEQPAHERTDGGRLVDTGSDYADDGLTLSGSHASKAPA